MNDIGQIIYALRELEQEGDVPRSVKSKINQTITNLQAQDVTRMQLNKAMNDLETLGEGCNLQPLTRTALLSVLSLIESTANTLR
ncbi:MAG: UPF0147 family protein, partial [Nanoarchaeota archaeon]